MRKSPILRFGWPRHARFKELEALRCSQALSPGSARLWALRQVLFRTGTRTFAFDLGPRRQTAMVAAGVSCALVFLGVIGDALLSRHEASAASQRAEQSADVIRQAQTQAADGRENLQRLEFELNLARVERDRALSTALADSQKIAAQRSEIDRLSAERAVALAQAADERLRRVDERDAILQRALAERERLIAEHRAATERATAEQARLTAERDRAKAERDTALATNRDALLALAIQTRRTVAEVEAIVARTGLDSGAGVRGARLASAPRGGPFVPWRAPVAGRDLPEAPHLDLVASDLARLQSLRDLIRRLPLASPVARASISDGFGFRIDPLNGRAALHEGIDLRSNGDSTVYAPAPGKVVFAGWQGEFGNTVEIDHGFGVRTRYAHLSEIRIAVDDLAYFYQPIGVIGATGRATGAHLHYEIRVDGQVRNPLNFLEASRHVRQTDRPDP